MPAVSCRSMKPELHGSLGMQTHPARASQALQPRSASENVTGKYIKGMQGAAWNVPSRLESLWKRAGTAWFGNRQLLSMSTNTHVAPGWVRWALSTAGRSKSGREEIYTAWEREDPAQMESLAAPRVTFPLPTEGADFPQSLLPNP